MLLFTYSKEDVLVLMSVILLQVKGVLLDLRLFFRHLCSLCPVRRYFSLTSQSCQDLRYRENFTELWIHRNRPEDHSFLCLTPLTFKEKTPINVFGIVAFCFCVLTSVLSNAKRLYNDLVTELGVLFADRVQNLRLSVSRSAITQEQDHLVCRK